MRLVGCLQFVDVAVEAILNPADDPEEGSLADLPPVFRTVHVREHEYVTLADPPGLRQGTFDRAGEDGCASFSKDEFPVIPEAAAGTLPKPVDAVLSAPLFDRSFHLSSAPNVQTNVRLKARLSVVTFSSLFGILHLLLASSNALLHHHCHIFATRFVSQSFLIPFDGLRIVFIYT